MNEGENRLISSRSVVACWQVKPLRQVRHEFGEARKKKKTQTGRSTSMFASRDSFSYTDEELAEYERQEGEAAQSRRNRPRTNLGDPGTR